MPPDDKPVMTPDDLRAWRARMGLSQAGAADLMGIHVQTVKSWEADPGHDHHRPIPPWAEGYTACLERERAAAGEAAE